MTDTLASALALVQTKLPLIAKNQTADVKNNDGKFLYSYDYADLADVSEQILPLLADAGLAWTCRPTLTPEGKFVLSYKLLHVSGEAEEGQYPLPNSGTPQAMGAAISYARRYSLCAVTGVAPKGDDNETADVLKTRTAQRQAARPARQRDPATAPQRTAQRARVDGPPLPGDDGAPDGPKMVTGPQRGKFLALFDEYGVTERDERLDITRRVVGRALSSANDLTAAEASKLIDRLEQAKEHKDGFTGFLSHLMESTE